MPEAESKLSPELRRWVADSPPNLQRTVVVQLIHGQDVNAAVDSLESTGFQVQSAGASVVIGVSRAQGLSEILKFPWVISLAIPKRLEKKL